MARRFTQPVTSGTQYVKLCAYGASGSGKTFTLLKLAQYIQEATKCEVFMLDTEKGAGHYLGSPPKRHAEFPTLNVLGPPPGSRTVEDVMAIVKEVEENNLDGSVIVIDSITHIWESCNAAYRRKKGMSEDKPLGPSDHGAIAAPYKRMLTALINVKAHVLCAGRETTDIQNGRNEYGQDTAIFLGTKIAARKETINEFDIAVRFIDAYSEVAPSTSDAPATSTGSVLQAPHKGRSLGSKVIHALIVKDRSGAMPKDVIEWPKPTDFLPYMQSLAGHHVKVETEAQSAARDVASFAGADTPQPAAEPTWTREKIKAALAKMTDRAKLEDFWKANKAEWSRLFGPETVVRGGSIQQEFAKIQENIALEARGEV